MRDEGLSAELEREFRADLRRSRRVTYDEWSKRPVWERLGEWLGAILQREQ